MKLLHLVIGSSLGLLLTGCPGDDGTTEDDTTTSNDTGTTTTGSTMDTTAGTETPTSDDGTTTDGTTDDGTTTDGTTDAGSTDDGTTTDGTTTDGTTEGTDTSTGTPALSFGADVWPIIEANCHSPAACHNNGPGAGGLDMVDEATAYANLVDVASNQSGQVRIARGAPDMSYVWAKLTNTQNMVGGGGNAMPPGGLNMGDMNIIEQWILDGAQP